MNASDADIAAAEEVSSVRAGRFGAAISLPALGAILFWSGVSPFGKYALDEMPPMVYIALRPMIAAALVFGVMTLLRKPMRIERQDYRRFVIAGVCLIGLSQLLFMGGLSLTSVSHLIILSSTSPLIGALYRWQRHGERPDRRSAVALALGFLGVVLVVGDAKASEGTSLAGDLLALAAGATWVAATVYPQPLVQKYGAARATGWFLLLPALVLLPVGMIWLGDLRATPPPNLAWVALVYGAVGMLAGNTLWQRAVQEVGPSRTLIYLYLEPFIVLIIAALALNERLTVIQALGGVLAMIGVILVRKR
ncbi:MAG TPA: DMT family transporter [Thermomicrobiales bacterium]|nr:DMT family transporter [Thermomicrobiales bacterium]